MDPKKNEGASGFEKHESNEVNSNPAADNKEIIDYYFESEEWQREELQRQTDEISDDISYNQIPAMMDEDQIKRLQKEFPVNVAKYVFKTTFLNSTFFAWFALFTSLIAFFLLCFINSKF